MSDMSHWHGANGSGPEFTGTLKSAAHAAASVAWVCVLSGGASTVAAVVCPKPALSATPSIDGEFITAEAKVELDEVTVATPTAFMLTTRPPAAAIAP